MFGYFDELKTYRERAGVSIAELARRAEVDRSTVSRAEKHHAIRTDLLVKITNALNDAYYKGNGGPVDFYSMITTRSRHGADASKVIKQYGGIENGAP